MSNNLEIKSFINFTVVFLTILILLPSAVPFIHLFEQHEQSNCQEETTHIHEQEIDCSICDFKISTFNYSFTKHIDNTLVKDNLAYADYYQSKKHRNIKHLFLLRGPPLFS